MPSYARLLTVSTRHLWWLMVVFAIAITALTLVAGPVTPLPAETIPVAVEPAAQPTLTQLRAI